MSETRAFHRADRLGVWLIGAFGGVGTTIAVGLAALARGLQPPTALATVLPRFAHLPFAAFDRFTVGGHDVRQSSFGEAAAELHRHSRVFTPALLMGCEADLTAWSRQVRPGLVRRSGKPVAEFANWTACAPPPGSEVSDWDCIEHAAEDIRAFQQRENLAGVIVVNVSSSEPLPSVEELRQANWPDLEAALKRPDQQTLPASSLYGLAAAQAGAAYINFTPSLGLDLPLLQQYAQRCGIAHMGKDGKTGETLMKAVLAPMFQRRNLEVLSWVGHNILGNRDGAVLKDPESRQGKFDSKGHLIGEILGYQPQTLVSIEHVASLGDWKTAWDHIHFRGFLDTPMSLQFIWQGCDSLLAAPLAIDLVRWTALAQDRGEQGPLTHLAAYFKSPMNVTEQDFFRQWDMLEQYARNE